MSQQHPPNPQRDAAAQPGTVEQRLAAIDEAATGLARELDALRRQVDPLALLPGRVDAVAEVVTDLANKVTALSARKGPAPCPSWLLAPTDADTVAALLDGLIGWLEAVYLRYPDAAGSLPECWCWHPDVVEELLWLMYAWLAAYQGPAAAVGLVGDWHDRYRPGVVRRIKQAAGSCSRERHQTRPGRPAPAGAPVVPAADEAAQQIAAWWAYRRTQPAPEPAARDDATPEPWAELHQAGHANGAREVPS